MFRVEAYIRDGFWGARAGVVFDEEDVVDEVDEDVEAQGSL